MKKKIMSAAGGLTAKIVGPILDGAVSRFIPTDGPLDLSSVHAAIRADPLALLSPLDLFMDLLRPHYFKNVRFDGPNGDPGWFGPDSAAWYVHTHAPSIYFGLLNTALIDILHQDIRYAVYDHSKLPGRDAAGKALPGYFSGTGFSVRAGRSSVFFYGVVLASSDSAETLCNIVKAMHSKVEGFRPDGVPYDAKDPEFFRFTYATVVDGIATAHAKYHPKPLRGAAFDQFYLEYSKVGEALGGTNLPTTKAECDDILENHPLSLGISITTDNVAYARNFSTGGKRLLPNPLGWIILNAASKPVRNVMQFRQPYAPTLFVYQQVIKIVCAIMDGIGGMREIEQAKKRVGRTAPLAAQGAPEPVCV
ncbi:MAG: oxygenase MpaB family protein [Segniliparus sp.]|uniref:oxygenase MpaB family protein n=1 Tax=Segniliparus sp. TaxID=2804064 RepID=UPI003F2D1F4B